LLGSIFHILYGKKMEQKWVMNLKKALYNSLIYAINIMMLSKYKYSILIARLLKNVGSKNGRDTTF
jgi:hypothetical protein